MDLKMKRPVFIFLVWLLALPLSARTLPAPGSDTLHFICNELLTRPTDHSVTVNACADQDIDLYFEFGTDSLHFDRQTTVQHCLDSIPAVFVLDSLKANTEYYYRMRYKPVGAADYISRFWHSFHTARPVGSTYTYAIEADPHMDTNSVAAVYALTLQNIMKKNPDFLLYLGDTFMSEKLPTPSLVEINKRHMLLRSFFDIVCHSTPLFLVQGNHDGELGWLFNNTANCLPLWNATLRKMYYPNPEPDSFYSGDAISEPFVGLRQNYYSWEWGNALFVVIDPYYYTKAKPAWGWTLGPDQYNWLRKVLTTSNAKFKFIFSHQLVGGNGVDGRGGTEFADFFEMGGKNADSTWGFSSYRAGWEKPIHQLMLENGVSIFFHGHDHFYGKQDKDGIVYQEVPQPSLKNFTTQSSTQYGYVNGTILPNRGYLLVSMTDTTAKIEYYRTYLSTEENATRHNGDISHSYTITKSAYTTGVREYNPIAGDYSLCQNYPNPFNPETTIRYVLPKAGDVKLVIYDALGREVSRIVDTFQQAGTYTVSFSIQKSGLPSGIYFYQLSSGNYTKVMKMICLK
jgi:predicted phosphodiesterase